MTSITCPRCGWTSHNPHDVAERYCGHCHVFLDDVGISLRLIRRFDAEVDRQASLERMRADAELYSAMLHKAQD